jgi:hypothetical protein
MKIDSRFCSPFMNTLSVAEEMTRVHRLMPRSWIVLPPTVWGPSMWHYIHLSSLYYSIYPYSEAIFRDWMKNIPQLLPCSTCHNHFKRAIKDYSSEEDAFTFFVKIHNQVNQRNKKELKKVEEMRDYYEELLAEVLGMV